MASNVIGTSPIQSNHSTKTQAVYHLLDIILVERKKKFAAIIYMDQEQNITITNPSNITNTPFLVNQPKTWFIPIANVTKPKSPNLSLIHIDFSEIPHQGGSSISVSLDTEKRLHQLNEYMAYQNSIQDLFKNNSHIRNRIITKIEKRGWNYSKHVPWNMIKIISNQERKDKTFILQATFHLSDNSISCESHQLSDNTSNSHPTKEVTPQSVITQSPTNQITLPID
jgi:hypothetical protein